MACPSIVSLKLAITGMRRLESFLKFGLPAHHKGDLRPITYVTFHYLWAWLNARINFLGLPQKTSLSSFAFILTNYRTTFHALMSHMTLLIPSEACLLPSAKQIRMISLCWLTYRKRRLHIHMIQLLPQILAMMR